MEPGPALARQPLEGGGGIAKPEKHDPEVPQSLTNGESSLWLHIQGLFDLSAATPEV